MTKLQNRLQNAALYLVCVFIACEHMPRMTAAKNVSLYLALVCAIWLYFTDRTRFAARVGVNFSLSRAPAFCLITFTFYAFLISAFPYAAQFDSLGDAAGEFGRGFAFLLIVYVAANGENNGKEFKFTFRLAAKNIQTKTKHNKTSQHRSPAAPNAAQNIKPDGRKAKQSYQNPRPYPTKDKNSRKRKRQKSIHIVRIRSANDPRVKFAHAA